MLEFVVLIRIKRDKLESGSGSEFHFDLKTTHSGGGDLMTLILVTSLGVSETNS